MKKGKDRQTTETFVYIHLNRYYLTNLPVNGSFTKMIAVINDNTQTHNHSPTTTNALYGEAKVLITTRLTPLANKGCTKYTPILVVASTLATLLSVNLLETKSNIVGTTNI